LKAKSLKLYKAPPGYADKVGDVLKSWDLPAGLKEKALSGVIEDIEKYSGASDVKTDGESTINVFTGDYYLFVGTDGGKELSVGVVRVGCVDTDPKKRVGIHSYIGQGQFARGNVGPKKLESMIADAVKRG
jgi:hypothetical protein